MHLSTLTASRIISFEQVWIQYILSFCILANVLQSIYAADILFIVTLGLTKLSVVAFFLLSTIGKSPRIVGVVLGSFIGSWILVSVIGLAFKCDLPHPWIIINNTCFDRVSLAVQCFWT